MRRQSVEELRRLIQRAAGEDLDPVTIRQRAERFSRWRFRQQIRAAVAEMVAAA